MLKYLRAILLTGCIVVGTTEVCVASGNMSIVFDQPGDCVSTAGWELSWEPTATADTKPSASAFGASIPNDGSKFVCGLNAQFVQSVVGVGDNRFWIRAVGVAPATFSEYSNFVDANVPFAAPVLRSVEPVL